MRIGVIGSGKIGATAARLLVDAIPFGRYRELPAAPFAGKIVADANNYIPPRDGNFAELDRDETTSTELLAAHLPEARVVKAFNTMQWKVLRDGGSPGPLEERLALFVAADDAPKVAVASSPAPRSSPSR
jgi:predicted dinucleotide-binding enzyme